MNSAAPTTGRGRPVCPACHRPLPTCFCRWVRACDNEVGVLLLQHPLEARHPKGSAGLLAHSLRRIECHVGETIDPSGLAPWLESAALLYPLGLDETGTLPAAWDAALQGPPRHLVVLDGTWRKSRKLLHLNPGLRALPRWPLVDPPASRYRIRQAQRAHQLSTLEATCLALQQIERRQQPYAALMDAFDGFIDTLAANASGGRPAR